METHAPVAAPRPQTAAAIAQIHAHFARLHTPGTASPRAIEAWTDEIYALTASLIAGGHDEDTQYEGLALIHSGLHSILYEGSVTAAH